MKRLNFQKIILIILLINISISQLLTMESYFPLSNNKYYNSNYQMHSSKLDTEKLHTEKISQNELKYIDDIQDINKLEDLYFEIHNLKPEQIIDAFFYTIVYNDPENKKKYNQFFNICKFNANSLSNITKNKINIDHPKYNKTGNNIILDFDLLKYKKLNKTLSELDRFLGVGIHNIKEIMMSIIVIICLGLTFNFNNKINYNFNVFDLLRNIITTKDFNYPTPDTLIKVQIYVKKINEIEKNFKTNDNKIMIISGLKTILKDFFPNTKLCKTFKRKDVEQYIENHPLKILIELFLLTKNEHEKINEDLNYISFENYHCQSFFTSNPNIKRKSISSKKSRSLSDLLCIFDCFQKITSNLYRTIIIEKNIKEINEYQITRINNCLFQIDKYILYKKDKKKRKFEIEVKYDMELHSHRKLTITSKQREKIQVQKDAENFKKEIKNNSEENYPLEKWEKLLNRDIKRCDEEIIKRCDEEIIKRCNKEIIKR